MKLSLKGGLVLLMLLVLPFVALSSFGFLDDFNDGVTGEDLDDYDSPIGEYSFEQILGSLGWARISNNCQVSKLISLGSEKCVTLLGSESGGVGIGYLHFEPTSQYEQWVEFDYSGASGLFPFSGVTIIGSTTSYSENFLPGSWHHFSYEHSEPIIEVRFQSIDHEYLNIDNLYLNTCELCE